jgi:hypothetical protein
MPHRVQNMGAGIVREWRGKPQCSDLHSFVLDHLRQIGCTFVPPGSSLSLPQMGNLGEFICFVVERAKIFPECIFEAANALRPLNTISNDGVDILWLSLQQNPEDDFVVLQEVKTTGDPDLTIHRKLVEDYRKRFGQSSAETLSTALQALKSRLVFRDRKPEWALRVTKLAATSPTNASRIFLMPTIVHDASAANAQGILLSVRTAVAALKWPESVIYPRSIALTELTHRLEQLSQGR